MFPDLVKMCDQKDILVSQVKEEKLKLLLVDGLLMS